MSCYAYQFALVQLTNYAPLAATVQSVTIAIEPRVVVLISCPAIPSLRRLSIVSVTNVISLLPNGPM